MQLPKDIGLSSIQVFTTTRVQTVTAGVAWEPSSIDRGFSSPTDVASLIITDAAGVAQTTVPLAANVPRGLIQDYTYTFGTTGVIEVM